MGGEGSCGEEFVNEALADAQADSTARQVAMLAKRGLLLTWHKIKLALKGCWLTCLRQSPGQSVCPALGQIPRVREPLF